LGRLFTNPADLQFAAGDENLLQLLEHLLRHACRQIDETVVLANIDPTDVHALDSGLVGDRADDVAGPDSMYRPHFDAKGFLMGAGRRRTSALGTLPRARRRVGLRRAAAAARGARALR